MLTPALFDELREFDSALIANTIDHIDGTPPHEFYFSGEISSLTPSLGPTVGVAFTAEVDTSTPGGTANMEPYWAQLEEMAKCTLPIVWVVKAVGSRPEHECIIGDGMAKLFYSVGCIGLVSDGRVRDVAGLLTTPFAAYCRGTAIHHGVLRVRSINQPVEVGGVTVQPGNIIHASSEGVIRIPPRCLERIPANAVKMRAFEHEAHMVCRRTDRSPAEKRASIQELLVQYDFGKEKPREKRSA